MYLVSVMAFTCFIITLVLVPVFYVVNKRSGQYVEGGDYLMGGLVGSLVAGAIGSLIAIAISAAVVQFVEEDVETRRISLVSLGDSIGGEGSFFLGSGTIEQEARYFYYSGTSETGYKIYNISADEATIFYTDNDPRIEFERTNDGWFTAEERVSEYRVYVPEGSITQQYVLDAG